MIKHTFNHIYTDTPHLEQKNTRKKNVKQKCKSCNNRHVYMKYKEKAVLSDSSLLNASEYKYI